MAKRYFKPPLGKLVVLPPHAWCLFGGMDHKGCKWCQYSDVRVPYVNTMEQLIKRLGGVS